MQIIRRVFKTKSICTRHICVCGLFVFALIGFFLKANAQSPYPGIGVNDIRLNVVNRTKASLARDAGEFYRVDGRKIRLLRSLEKVAVHHKPNQGPAVSKRFKARQRTGRLFSVEQELAKEQMLIMRTSGVSSLAELNEAVSQIQQESDVDQVTPVFINEETGLEMIPTDQFIVKLAPEATLEQLDILNGQMGITLVRRLRGTTDQFVLRMDTFSIEGLLTMCEVYVNEPIIVWASPNFLSRIVFDSASDNFNYHPTQWHLEMIEAAGAWGITTGSKDIVVAVIDDGVDIEHKDLRKSFPADGSDHSDNGYPNDYFGWDFYDDDNNPRPSHDEDNHGTGIAGVIAANKGNNAEGVLGCAYYCTLMAVKISEGSTKDNASWVSDKELSEAILYAAGFHMDGKRRWHGADVINMSFHFSYAKAEISEALQKAATDGRMGKGCPIFCSSGNDPDGWTSFALEGFKSDKRYTFRWEYSRDSSGSSDNGGGVWLDSIVFPGGDTERFEGDQLPSGWETGGDSNWVSVQDGSDGDHAMTGWDGQHSKSMRAGPLDDNQSSWLEIQRYVGEGSLQFWYWPAMEPGEKYEFVVKLGNDELYRETFDSEKKAQDYIPVVAYPASHPDTIAVGASTDFDYRADYSRYGFGLDFVAPSSGGSEYIYTTDRTDTNTQINGYEEGDYNAYFSGTSAASPLAAGVAALMLSANPDLTAQQVRYIMQDTCEQIGNEPYSEAFDNNPNTNKYYGYGRINAFEAVAYAQDMITWNEIGGGQASYDEEQNTWTLTSKHFRYKHHKGDGQIIANLTSLAANTTATLSIRENLSSTAEYAEFSIYHFVEELSQLEIIGGKEPEHRYELSFNSEPYLSVLSELPIWIRLEREGNSIKAYYTVLEIMNLPTWWIQTGSVEIPMDSDAFVGFGVSGGTIIEDDFEISYYPGSATFKDVSIGGLD